MWWDSTRSNMDAYYKKTLEEEFRRIEERISLKNNIEDDKRLLERIRHELIVGSQY